MGKEVSTYSSENSRVVGHLRWIVLAKILHLNLEILYIAASKDNVIVDLIGGRNLFVRVASPALGTE